MEAGIFDLFRGGALGARLFQFTNRFTTYISYANELNFVGWDWISCSHNLGEPDFRFPHSGRCRGATLEIFKSIHSIFIWLSWNLVGWYRTSIRTIVMSRMFLGTGRDTPYFTIFCGHHLYIFSLSPSQKSLSSRSERWPQRPFGAIFIKYR